MIAESQQHAIALQRDFGVILLVLGALIVLTVIGLEWLDRREKKQQSCRPGCAWCAGDRNIQHAIDDAIERAS